MWLVFLELALALGLLLLMWWAGRREARRQAARDDEKGNGNEPGEDG